MAKNDSIKKKLDMFINEKFQETKLEDALGDRFGRYSKYIIQERAIPDVRDGLKPVQRRILYGMFNMKVTSTQPYKKSARIVGDVMGKYHPHGDSSIYEALVRMSQNWKMGVTLIDMHGNNGSIDGDGPAAMRYTETRLSKNAEYILQDIDKNTVPFIPNFDDEETEPTVLPARFPNLLVNGAMGISSGYATYIPTHNLNEVVNATIERINNPNMTVDDLLEIMPGPDFPTGGIIMGKDGIREAFLTGSGTVVVRSKYEIEEMGPDQQRIVITEIPYDTLKNKTVERMEQLRLDGKVPDVIESRDESGRDGLRIAIDLKKGANADAIINYFFKNTDLQCNINYNMVSICNRRPMRLGVLPILDAYIEHQKDVVTNRTNYLLAKAEKRLHIVDGLIKMIDILDEVIAAIRKSKNKADAKENLVKLFGFTEEQAEAIVTMQLYRLTNQDVEALMEERHDLNIAIEEYNKILSSEKELLKVIKKELTELNKKVIVERRTEIKDESAQIKIDETELVAKEQVMVAVTHEGYIKRASMKAYNASKNNGLKDNDYLMFLEEVNTLDTLLMFTNQGNFVYLPVYKIPECKFKDVGAFISSIVQTSANEKFVQVFKIEDFEAPSQLVLITKQGAIKQTLLKDFAVTRYTKAVRAMKFSDSDELVSVDLIKDPLEIMVFTKNCEGLRFRATDVSLYGTNAGGTKAINLKPGDSVVKVIYCNKNDDFLLMTNRNTIKRMKVTDLLLTKRARSGSQLIKKIKANPYYLLDATKMTPNQYKENVNVNLTYSNGDDIQEASSFKYNVSDGGKTISPNNPELKTLIRMSIDKPNNLDIDPSIDYLQEDTIFSPAMEASNPAPIVFDDEEDKSIKAGKNNNENLLNDLESILSKHSVEVKKAYTPNI
nr:DNA topoisomerase IV subunit A [Acholeplasmatales bacterium]